MKHLKLAAIALLCALAFTACDDEENPQPTICPPGETATGAFVLNQGNQIDGISGSMDYLDYGTGTYTSGFFLGINEQALGDGPQDGLVYGSKMYVVLFDSKLVWVCDAASGKIVKQIRTTDPEGLCATDGKVYVSNNDGYVTCIDTLTLEAAPDRLEVGPNPVGLAAANGSVYVAVSDGYNSANGYANGFKVVRIKTDDFTKAAEIAVGMNPTACAADAKGNVFVVCNGNYGTVRPAVWKITPDDRAAEFAPGSLIAVAGQTLYAIYSYTDWTDWQNPVTEPLTYKAYDTTTGAVANERFVPADGNAPVSPIAIDVDPRNGEVFITSEASPNDYTSPGYVYRYTASGAFKARYEAGVRPYAVFFK